MNIALSPYLLTTREAPAMAALLLAERVVTLRPAPARHADASDLRAAARSNPSYLGLMESWRWSIALWRAGVIVPAWGGEDVSPAAARAAAEIEEDEEFAPLRGFMHAGLFERIEESLERIARDILKGGPDPGITIPVHAGMDAFAARHGLVVARGAGLSLAQRAEERLMQPLARIVVPVLTQAPAESMLAAREMLGPRLKTLREAMLEGGGGVADAAGSYARAFEEALEGIRAAGPVDEVRVMHGSASLSLVRLPARAVLSSSLDASGLRERAAPVAASRGGGALPALRGESSVLALVVRVLGR